MGVALYGKSAMQLWLHRFNALDTCAALGVGAASFVARFAARSGRRLKQRSVLACFDAAACERDLSLVARCGVRLPCEVVSTADSFSQATRLRGVDVIHSSGNPFESDRYFSLLGNAGLLVPEPELAVAQAACELGDLGVIWALSLLCGDFSFSGSSGALVRCEPLSSMRRVSGFIERSAGLTGVGILRRVSPYVVERAASPPEIDLALKLSLPPAYGGSGLPRPDLNARINLGERAAMTTGRGYVVPDVLWRDAKCALEYDSDEIHLNPEQARLDSTKRFALSLMGYETVSVTNLMLKDRRSMDRLACSLARILGVRIRPRARKYEQRRSELFALGRRDWSRF